MDTLVTAIIAAQEEKKNRIIRRTQGKQGNFVSFQLNRRNRPRCDGRLHRYQCGRGKVWRVFLMSLHSSNLMYWSYCSPSLPIYSVTAATKINHDSMGQSSLMETIVLVVVSVGQIILVRRWFQGKGTLLKQWA